MTKDQKMPAWLETRFNELALARRPEYLSKNGRATMDQALERARHIDREWRFLEEKAGRKVELSQLLNSN